ncbi:MAG: hypothetical protein E7676_00785 [Ruminococcaceae bacterium]|nr:hypothetical protein [Oscillospiraceae bacterium]
MNKERELDALAEVLLILTKEFVENPTVAIKDAFGYVRREIITPILASETAYWDFYNKTSKDIRSIDWRESRTVKTKNGQSIVLHKEYTGDHMQPCGIFKSELVSAYENKQLTVDFIKNKLKNRYVCWITQEENKRLNALGYKSNRPDPEKAYQEAGIVIYCPPADENSSFPEANVISESITQKCIETTSNEQREKCKDQITREIESLQKTAQPKVEKSAFTGAIKKSQPQVHKTITYCSKNTFVFKNEKRFNKERKRHGFITLDNEGRIVAVAAMHEDKRGAAYGQAELCFYDEYNSEFGKWRLVAISKERLSFSKLTEILKANGSYKATIDPRKGS